MAVKSGLLYLISLHFLFLGTLCSYKYESSYTHTQSSCFTFRVSKDKVKAERWRKAAPEPFPREQLYPRSASVAGLGSSSGFEYFDWLDGSCGDISQLPFGCVLPLGTEYSISFT